MKSWVRLFVVPHNFGQGWPSNNGSTIDTSQIEASLIPTLFPKYSTGFRRKLEKPKGVKKILLLGISRVNSWLWTESSTQCLTPLCLLSPVGKMSLIHKSGRYLNVSHWHIYISPFLEPKKNFFLGGNRHYTTLATSCHVIKLFRFDIDVRNTFIIWIGHRRHGVRYRRIQRRDDHIPGGMLRPNGRRMVWTVGNRFISCFISYFIKKINSRASQIIEGHYTLDALSLLLTVATVRNFAPETTHACWENNASKIFICSSKDLLNQTLVHDSGSFSLLTNN